MNKLALVVATAVLVAACGSDANVVDVKGIKAHQPDVIEVYSNIDTHPNIARICIDGVGFATTSRDAQAAIQRVPEWDAFCAAHRKAR